MTIIHFKNVYPFHCILKESVAALNSLKNWEQLEFGDIKRRKTGALLFFVPFSYRSGLPDSFIHPPPSPPVKSSQQQTT